MTRTGATALLLLTTLAASPAHAQLVGNRADATSCASAIGGSVTASHISVVCGIPPETLNALVNSRMQAQEEGHRKVVALLEENLALTRGQIQTALSIIGEAHVPPQQIAPKLVEFALSYEKLKANAAAQPGDSTKVTALWAETKLAADRGDLAQADRLLAEIQKLQAEERNRQALDAARAPAQRGEFALASLRYREAAAHFAEAAALVPAANGNVRSQYLEREATALFRQGNEFGDNVAAAAAIDRYRSVLALRPREQMPAEWASAQNDLGLALKVLGEREGSGHRLEEAVAVYQEALKVQTRERAPQDWARLQDNLGSALTRLGEREAGTARLGEAVAAYRASLTVRTRDQDRFAWARTQSNLGTALWAIGERLWDSGERQRSIALLAESVAAFKMAIQEYTFAGTPLAWGSLHNNLGNALDSLGQRVGEISLLEEAVVAYQEALGGWTRERVPLDWATVQDNLAATLLRLGQESFTRNQRDRASMLLEGALDAYGEALKERSRERTPLLWAATQNNLAAALFSIADMTKDKRWLRRALPAVDAALQVWRTNAIEAKIAPAELLRTNILAAMGN